VVTNHGPAALRVPLRLPDEAIAATAIEPTGAAQLPRDEGAVEVALEPHGAAIIAWRTAAGAR
jgi:hypothetical protein